MLRGNLLHFDVLPQSHKARFAADCFNVGSRIAGGPGGHQVQFHVPSKGHILGMNLEDLQSCCVIRWGNVDESVEPSRPEDRGVDNVWSLLVPMTTTFSRVSIPSISVKS